MVTYLKDETTGVTVELSRDGCSIAVHTRHNAHFFTDLETRAIVEGLLRRMLEREGDDATYAWLCKVLPECCGVMEQ